MLKRTRQLEHAFGEPCNVSKRSRQLEHDFGEPCGRRVWMRCRLRATCSHDQLSSKLVRCAVVSADRALNSCKLLVNILLRQDTWLWVRSRCHHASNGKETTQEQRKRSQDGGRTSNHESKSMRKWGPAAGATQPLAQSNFSY